VGENVLHAKDPYPECRKNHCELIKRHTAQLKMGIRSESKLPKGRAVNSTRMSALHHLSSGR